MNNNKLKEITRLALLTAITIILAATPLGYIPLLPALSLTIMTVPIAVGALTVRPYVALVLSAVFGITSFARAPLEPLSAAMLQQSIVYTILVTIGGRLLVGLIVYLIASLIYRKEKVNFLLYALVGGVAALANTFFFLSGLSFLFADVISDMLGISGYLTIFVTFAPSAIGEAIAGAVLTGILVPVLKRVAK